MLDAELLEVDGKTLEVRRGGPSPGEAPTLLFLHPGLGCAATWRRLPERLAAATGCGTLVYSRAGHGASAAVSEPLGLDFMHREAFETLPRLIATCGLRRFLLVGHSDGASVALIYAGAVRQPGLMGLAALAPHVVCEEETVDSARRAGRRFGSGELRDRLERHHAGKTEWVFESWYAAWTDPAFRAWNLEEFLPGIEVPLLVIQGAEDEYGTRRQVDSILGGCRSRRDLLWLSDCGHAPHRDRAEIVEPELVRFVRSVLGASPTVAGRPV